MTHLTLKRIFLANTYTIGKLYVDNVYLCDTIEDKARDKNKDGDLLDEGEEKVFGETAIPYGKYKVVHHSSKKFPNTFWIKDVPHFSGILIHTGNTAVDSHGCIIVGQNLKKGMVLNSKVCMDKLRTALKDKKDIEIEIL